MTWVDPDMLYDSLRSPWRVCTLSWGQWHPSRLCSRCSSGLGMLWVCSSCERVQCPIYAETWWGIICLIICVYEYCIRFFGPCIWCVVFFLKYLSSSWWMYLSSIRSLYHSTFGWLTKLQLWASVLISSGSWCNLRRMVCMSLSPLSLGKSLVTCFTM